jgi:hypothetical protein
MPLTLLRSSLRVLLLAAAVQALPAFAQARLEFSAHATPASRSVRLVDGAQLSPVVVSDNDAPLVKLSAQLFADDLAKVTGKAPAVVAEATADQVVIAGTLGQSRLIDRLARAGKLKGLDQLRGQWEATLWQTVEAPLPKVKRALVIVGSDPRGTAYGLMQMSERMGVSPWHWWADVPPKRQASLYVQAAQPSVDKPAVRYRGIFVNDEDWGLIPWIKTTFDPAHGNFGPKTYEKIFELMLRMRLNYIWPAMHEVSTEFGSNLDNARMAARYGILLGSSHCEPMLYNNVHWDEKTQGPWDYARNKDAIHAVWETTAANVSGQDGVWTMGIRGIHDRGMQGPPDTAVRMATLGQVFKDQQALITKHTATRPGTPAKIFVPYKEVLPIYDAGLPVPDDVTLVWVDDNFGYIRRLSNPAERKRAGGAGVYWHLSYYGGPHSYTWINTTAPALMWEEFHKAWANEARTAWVINVGDIKPMEVGMDYFARLAWAPESMGPESASRFLKEFAERNFSAAHAPALAELMAEHFRLGTIRKPELMERSWALSLTAARAAQLRDEYQRLLRMDAALAAALPAEARDAYFEMIGFPARVVAYSGLIFLADRDVQMGVDAAANTERIQTLRNTLTQQVDHFNNEVAGGKWKGVMPGLETAANLMAWNSQVRWPWGETKPVVLPDPAGQPSESRWRPASATLQQQAGQGGAAWHSVPGLGGTGRALVVLPANLQTTWRSDPASAPALEYEFNTKAVDGVAYLEFMPTFRLIPGTQLGVAVSLDGQALGNFEVPGASGSEDENGRIRQDAVQTNSVRLKLPLGKLEAGKHRLRVVALDPGLVFDRIWLP